jgi:hypothetical protein
MAQRAWYQWVDIQGQGRVTRYDSPNGVQAGILRINLQNVSAAGAVAVTTSSPGGPYTEPGSDTFPLVSDNLALTFMDDGGYLFSINIPAPIPELFEGDSVTFGGTAANLLITAILPALVNPVTGTPANTFIAGTRNGRGVS